MSPGHDEPPIRRRRARVVLACIAFGLVLSVLGWVRGTTSYDDPFITYTYAASFARGDGLTWNGEAVLGTSTPFLALLLGLLERAAPLGVPVWGAALHWISVGVASIALLLLGRRESWTAAAAFAAVALPLQVFVHLHVGSEMLPALAAVLIGALLLSRERWWAAGIALAVAVAFRAEAGAAAIALAAAHLPARRRSGGAVAAPVARVAAAGLAAIAAWSVALLALTGALVPSTLAAKRAQAESALGIWRSGFEVFPEAIRDLPRQLFLLSGGVGSWLTAALLALGVAGLVRSRREAAPGRLALLLWGPLQLTAVAALEVAYYPWYSIPFFFSATLLVAQTAELLPLAASGTWWSSAARAFAGGVAGLLAVLLLGYALPFWHRHGSADSRRVAYESVADLVATFPRGTTVAAFEVGYLGHRSRLPVLDLLGLVTPRAELASVRSGELRENVDRLDPDLLMLPLGGGILFEKIVGDPVSFADRYELERLQLGPGTPLVVYRRRALASTGVDDLLPELREAGAVPIVRGAGYWALAARLAAGSRAEIVVAEPVPGSHFFAGAISDRPDGVRLALRLTRGEGRSRRIANLPLGTTAWSRVERDLPPLSPGDRLVIECDGPPGASCDLGAPHLAPLAATAQPAR